MNRNMALLIIDVQMVMFSVENPVYKSKEVLSKICALIEKARFANVPVIFIQHTDSDDKPMGKGKPLWRLHPDLLPQENDLRFLKYTPDCFHETGLNDKLCSLGVKNLVIAGMQTEICVDTTCRRAFGLGYNVTLVSDAHSTFDTKILAAEKVIQHHNGIISAWFGKLSKAEEVIL